MMTIKEKNPMPEILLAALQELEKSTKNLASIASDMERGDLRNELGKTIGYIVSAIDFEIMPAVRRIWPDVTYRPVD